jgi:peptide/nickel transport system ATP-binding protein
MLLCDEITTMLDVITQAQVWNILTDIAKERKMGMIVITHNMALAKRVCTRIIELPEINHIDVLERNAEEKRVAEGAEAVVESGVV